MSYANLTDRQLQIIQRRIMSASWNATQFYSYFQAHKGLVNNVGKGIITHITTKWEKMKPGQISRGFQDLPDSHPRFTEVTTTLCELATKVVIPVQERDAWASNNQVGSGDKVQQTIQKQILALTNQVDQFLAQGDLMKTPLADDKAAGESKYTGLFNGFTTLGGGDGGDNNMTAAGDYISDFSNRVKALINAGFEAEKYIIMSDVDTWQAAQKGNNLYTGGSTVSTEMDAVMARKDVQTWIKSPNAQNSSSQSQILVTTPYTSMGEPAYRLHQGYNFDVIPLYGGGLGPSAMYEIIVAWSGAIEELHATAVQRSGSLTLV
jgi:hypothetical protein